MQKPRPLQCGILQRRRILVRATYFGSGVRLTACQVNRYNSKQASGTFGERSHSLVLFAWRVMIFFNSTQSQWFVGAFLSVFLPKRLFSETIQTWGFTPNLHRQPLGMPFPVR